MKIPKKSLLYAIYIIAITGFFLYYLFPSDTLKSYLAYRLSQGNPDITVTIDRVSPVLPPGVNLHDVGIVHRNSALIDLDSLKIMPGILSLFSAKSIVNFKGRVNSGTFSGKAEIGNNSVGQEIIGDGRISGVQILGIPALERLPVGKISGVLNGNFVYGNAGRNRSVEGKLTLSQCRIELNKPVFNLDSLEFKDINADLTLNNDTLTIKRTRAKGNQLDADLTGTIALAGQTALNLTVSVTPHHLLLAKIEKTLPMNLLRKKNAGKAAISFKVDGTLDKPGFSLN